MSTRQRKKQQRKDRERSARQQQQLKEDIMLLAPGENYHFSEPRPLDASDFENMHQLVLKRYGESRRG